MPAHNKLITSLKNNFSTKLSGFVRRNQTSIPTTNYNARSRMAQKPPLQAKNALENYLLALKNDQCSEATIRNYRSDINQFIDFIDEEQLEKILTKPKIQAFVAYQTKKDLKASSIKRKLASITQFGLWAQDQGFKISTDSWSEIELDTDSEDHKTSPTHPSIISSAPVINQVIHQTINQTINQTVNQDIDQESKHALSQDALTLASQSALDLGKQASAVANNQVFETKESEPLASFQKQGSTHQIKSYLSNYLLALKLTGCSNATIKNYRSDISQFFEFANEKELESLITKPKIEQFVSFQIEKGLKESSILRKVTSITQFGLWARKKGVPLDVEMAWPQHIFEKIDGSLVQKNQDNSIKKTKTSQVSKILNSLGFGKKNDNNNASYLDEVSKRHPTKAWAYLNLIATLLFMLGLGYFGYQQFNQVDPSLAFPTSLTRPDRILSFQGRLTDTAQNPMTSPTSMQFRLYDSLDSSGSNNLLWNSNVCTVQPDQDGIFASSLGAGAGLGADNDNCGAEIPDSVFTENSNVWLEVQVVAETLEPRQPIRTVAYAINAETLQGFPASASAVENTVLIMDNNGEIVLGNANPKIKATGDSFTLEADTMTFQTPSGSNGDIIFDADGLGGVISRDYFSAPGATLSATYAGGTALVARGGPTGTANIQEWQNSSGTGLSAISAGGNLGIGTVAPGTKLDVRGGAGTQVGYFEGRVRGEDAIASNEFATLGQISANLLPSGISGQTLRHDGSTWIANSTLFNNGTNVGIGTTNPSSAMLQVNAGSNESAIFTNLGYITTNEIRNNITTGLFIRGAQTNTIQSAQFGATAHINQTSGSRSFVSVGTSHFIPTSGTAEQTGILVPMTINQTGGANGITRGLYINPTLTSAANWRAIDISSNAGYGIYQSGASATNYFAGNLGIGTTSPSYALDVVSGSSIAGRFNGRVIGADAVGGDEFVTLNQLTSGAGIPSGINGQTLRHNGSTWVANSTLFNDGTNVGIGTTSPGAKLNIYKQTSGYEVLLNIDGGNDPGSGSTRLQLGNTASSIRFQSYGSGAPGILASAAGITASTGNAFLLGGASGMPVYLYSNNQYTNPQFSISSAGNIGIGTTTPTELLDVNGRARIRTIDNAVGDVLTVSGTGVVQKRTVAELIGDGGGVPSARTLTMAGTTNQITVSPTGAQDLSANRTWTFSLPQDIHTSATPTFSTLSLSSTANNTLNLSGNGAGITFSNASNGVNQILTTGNSHLALMPNGTGNVGIGTTNPTEKLDIDGLIRIRGGAPGAGKVLQSDATGVGSWVDPSTLPAGSVSFANITGGTNTTATMIVGAGSSLNYTSTGTINASSLEGLRGITIAQSLRANNNITGGGTIAVDGSYNFSWSQRFIVISNGRGSHFGTVGYFDINMPPNGTALTGIGGASNTTWTASGAPLGTWQALYYILPIGSSNATVNANFRIANYSTDLEIPANWILLAVRNADAGYVRVGTGLTLKPSQSYASATFSSSYVPNSAQLLGATWEAPLTIGSTTANTGRFTTLEATGTSNALTLSGNGANIAFSNTGGTVNQITTAGNSHLALMPNGTGNVGIGTTTPASLLHVSGAAGSGGHILATIQNTINGSNASPTHTGIHFVGWNNGSKGAILATDRASNTWGSDLLFFTHPSSAGGNLSDLVERMRINQAGNVGIGTTSPTERLDVSGNVRFSGALMPNNQAGTNGQFLISQGAGNAPAWTSSIPASTVPLSGITGATGTNTIDSLNFAQTWNWSTASTHNPMTMTANALTTGSLLSLTSSNASLNSTNGLLYVANTGASTTGIVARIQSNSTAGSGLTVRADGNVGVGTTSPGIAPTSSIDGSVAKLEVSGNIRINTNSTASTGEISNLQFTKCHTSGCASTYSSAEIRQFTNNGYDGGLRLYTSQHIGGGAYNVLPVMTLNHLGNVGIGTTNPNNFRLQVSGNVGPQAHNTSDLGSSAIRWANVYGMLGNFSTSVTSPLGNFSTSVTTPLVTNADNLTLSATGANSILMQTNGSTRWSVLSGGILESNGAQTIRTSTGNLTLATNGGNGHILFSPNGTGRVGIGTTLPTAGNILDINGNTISSGSFSTTVGDSYGQGTQLLASNLYVQSRGINLVTNGTGLLKNNYNFSGWTYDPAQAYSATGSFSVTSNSTSKQNDELIPVDAGNTYRLTAYTKWQGDQQPRQYIGTIAYDSDNLQINPQFHMRQAGTDTTLAQPLTPGDTVVYLTSAANWNNSAGASTHLRTIIIFGYSNSSGYTYPDYTYSRRSVVNAYNDGAVDYVNNTVTLSSPWPGTWGTIPAGTAISNGSSGGTYKYIASLNNLTTPDWTKYEGLQGGIDLSGTNINSMFPPGTASIRILFLLNRDTTNPQTTWASNIDFREADVQYNNLGNVGIGTTDPTQKLHIVGNMRLSGAFYDGSNTAGTNGQILTSTGTSTSWTDVGSLGVRWNAITAPTGNQTLSMSTHPTSFDWATGTGTNDLFSLTTANSSNGTGYLLNIQTGTSSTVNPFRVRAGTTEALFINNSGNVAIGTTTPISGYKLSVVGDIGATGDIMADGGDFHGGPGDTLLKSEKNIHFGVDYDNNDANSYFTWGKNTGLGTAPVGANELMRLTEEGNLGIGTTTPPTKLSVDLGNVSSNLSNLGANIYGNAGANIGYSGYSMSLDNSTANASGYLRLARTSASNYLGMEIGSQSRDGIRFLTHASTPTEAMRIDADGNVGIGATSPEGKLHVVGSTLNLFDRYVSSPSVASGVQYRTARGTQTSPSANLSGDFIGGISMSGHSGSAFTGTRSAIFGYAGQNFTGSNQGSGLQFWTTPLNSTSASERMRIDPSGNIGIGTTNPNNFRLQVSGNVGPQTNNTSDLGSIDVRWANVFGAIGNFSTSVLSKDGSFDTSVITPLVTNAGNLTLSATGANSILMQTNGSTRWSVLSGGILESNGAQTIRTSTGNLTLATNGGNGHILFSPNGTGNVGIGTTVPSAVLEVNGSTRITGSLIVGANSTIGDFVQFNDTFDGSTINTSDWIVTGSATQNNAISVTGAGSWTNRGLTTTQSYRRSNSLTLTADFTPTSTSGSTFTAMIGFSSSTTMNYTNMPHAIYFSSGNLQIYENSILRGTVGSYNIGTTYRIKIVTNSTGAIYYLSSDGGDTWTKIYDGTANNITNATLYGRLVVNNAVGTGTIDNFTISNGWDVFSNSQLIAKNLTFGTQLFGNGSDSVTSPSYSWMGDTNTGIYRPSAGQVGITLAGTQRALFTATDVTLTGQTSLTASSLNTLTTSSNVNWDGATSLTFRSGNAIIYGSNTANGNLTLHGTSHSTRTTSYLLLQPTAGNVGIGTTTPGERLDVSGNIRSDGYIYGLATWGITARTQGLSILAEGSVDTSTNQQVTFGASVIIMNPLAGSFVRANAGTYNLGAWGALYKEIPPTVANGSNSNATVTSWNNNNRAYDGRDRVLLCQTTNTGTVHCRGFGNKADGSIGADLAEYFYSNESLVPGEILSIKEEMKPGAMSATIGTTNKVNDPALMGIVSTEPGFTMNQKYKSHSGYYQVALQGQVPAIVDDKNGPIKPGDIITSGTLKGAGTKAVKAGATIGKSLGFWNPSTMQCNAVESYESIVWPDSDPENLQPTCFVLPDGTKIGKVMVFMSVSWYDPDVYLNDSGDFVINTNSDNSFEVVSQATQTKSTRIGIFAEAVIAKIRSGFINTQELIVEKTANINNLSVNTFTIQGMSLSDYIASVVSGLNLNSSSTQSSLITETNELISPIVEDLFVENNLTAGDATIEGKIIALDLESDTGSFNDLSAENAEITSLSSETATINSITTQDITADSISTSTIIATGSTRLAQLNITGDAEVSGKTKLADLMVLGDSTVSGTLESQDLKSQTATINDLNTNTIQATSLEIHNLVNTDEIRANTSRLAYLEAQISKLNSIEAQTAQIVNATISGTLYADNIANFEEKVAQAFRQPSLLSTILSQDQGFDPLANFDLDSTLATTSAELNKSLADLNNAQNDVVISPSSAFINEYLKLNGNGYIGGSLALGKTLLVGQSDFDSDSGLAYGQNLQIGDSYIESINHTDLSQSVLNLQPSGRGRISLMAGLMTLTEDGQVLIAGDLKVAGAFDVGGNVNTGGDLVVGNSLLSNIIEPLNPDESVQFRLSKNEADATGSAELKQSRLEIIDELGSPVATISASGKASFEGGLGINAQDLSQESINPLNPTEFVATQTAGRGKIPAGITTITIKSTLINQDTLIYVTPLGSTNNQVLYVKTQTPDNPKTAVIEGKFEVGFDQALANDVTFNWWLVN